MGKLKEKVAYLQGLTQGLNVSDHSAEGKLLVNIIDVLDDLAEEFDHIHLAQEDLGNYVETIDEDLTELEENFYQDDVSDNDASDNDDWVEVACPVCHEVVTFESDLLDEDDALEITCPSCGGVIYDNTLEAENVLKVESPINGGLHPGI